MMDQNAKVKSDMTNLQLYNEQLMFNALKFEIQVKDLNAQVIYLKDKHHTLLQRLENTSTSFKLGEQFRNKILLQRQHL